MKLKNLAASLNATFDNFVTSIENHEAVAASMIQDVSRAAARLRVQHNRVQNQIKHLERSQQTLQTQMACWQTRAKTRSLVNPEQALQCLRQRDATRAQLERVTAEQNQSQELQAQMTANLQQIEHRLSELRSRRASLATREACGGVMAKTTQTSVTGDVEALFERWEEAVIHSEYKYRGHSDSTGLGNPAGDPSHSAFAREFEQREYNDNLAEELADLQRLQEEQQSRRQEK